MAIITAKPLFATARYRATIRAEMEIIPRDPFFGVGLGTASTYDIPPGSSEDTTFMPVSSAVAIDILQTAFYEVECVGSARWNGAGDPADGSGFCVAQGGFFVTNGLPDAREFQAHITIRECSIEGTVDDDVAEAAGVELYVHLEPVAEISGRPDNPIFSFARNTRDEGIGTHFDIVCLPTDLFFPLTAPGGEDGAGPGEFILRFLYVNLRVGARVRAISQLSSTGVSIPLEFLPDGEKDPALSVEINDRVDGILQYFNDAVKSQLIQGANGSSKNLDSFQKEFDLFLKYFLKGETKEACKWLTSAVFQSDGLQSPPDLIDGKEIAFFNRKLRDVAENGLHCPVSHKPKSANEVTPNP